jgi:hypothetical protein
MHKFYLLSDSICGGFGQKSNKSFVHYALDKLNCTLVDLSKSGMCSREALYTLSNLPSLENVTPADIVVISIGNVDAKPVFVKNNFFSVIVPNRYRREKIDPRPYYSNRRPKRLFERLDNWIRTIVRYYCYFTGNYKRKISQKNYEENFVKIVDMFLIRTNKIIVILPSKIENRLFPGAEQDFELLCSFLISFCESKRIKCFDFKNFVTREHFLLDQFHLNAAGHDKVTSEFSSYLLRVM